MDRRFGRAFFQRGARALALGRELGEPIECALHVRLRKAGTLEVARQMLPFGHLRYLFEHVAIENVDQYVENAAGHHHQGRGPYLPPG